MLAALKSEILAKAEIKGNLDTYKYYDNVSGSCAAYTAQDCAVLGDRVHPRR